MSGRPGAATTEQAVIEVVGVSRSFAAVQALSDVDLEVRRGHILALLGHNGAGKTTLLRVINGLLRPDRGVVRVFGLDPLAHGATVRRRTGAMPEAAALDDLLTVRETLQYYGRINGLPRTEVAARLEELTDVLELGPLLHAQVRSLSAGMRQRVGLARAMMHRPELLLLDEPTSNLDPLARVRVRELLRGLTARGHSVVVATHHLDEVAHLADDVAILRLGRLLVTGTPDELQRLDLTGHTTRIRLAPPADLARHHTTTPTDRTHHPTTPPDTHDHAAPTDRALQLAAGVTGVAHVELAAPDLLLVNHGGDGAIPAVVERLVRAGFGILEVVDARPTLEDVYTRLHHHRTEVTT